VRFGVYIAGTLLLGDGMISLTGLSRLMGLMGIVAITVGISYPAPAGATFSGAQNGNVAFASICDSNTGQAIYSINPDGTPPATYACPGGASPNYTQSTAGSIDSMPYFSSEGSTLYFSSNRPSSGNNAGANGNFALYQVAYPPTVSGSAGSQSDGAVQITFPIAGGGSSNDYAPTVSADGTTLAFIRCNDGTTSCALYVQSPIVGGTPTIVTTSALPLQPNPVSGEASRPEIDPADNSQILYVGTDNHIHLVSMASPPAFTERDLSNESGIATGQVDEYPDWNPAGTRIILNRSHKIYVLDPTAAPATACGLWASDPGTEIEPVFAPTDTATSSGTTSGGSCNPAGNSYVWTKLGGGSNIILDEGHMVGNADTLVDLTNDRTNNSQPAWQPIPLGAQTPEVPVVVLLPSAGAVLLAGAVTLERRRRRDRGADVLPA
jgi:WD40-like Beta Propeller Repeat